MKILRTSRLEIAANIVLLLTCLGICFELISKHRVAGSTPAGISRGRLGVGNTLTLSSVDWAQSKWNLVLILSSKCKYCRESEPFHRRLLSLANSTGAVRAVALVLGTSTSDPAYPHSAELDFTLVRLTKPAEIGSVGTPSILLVDNRGVVAHMWRGKMPPESEDSVIEMVKSKSNGL